MIFPKKFLLTIFLLIIVSCSPSPEALATQTAGAWTPTPEPTKTSYPTATEEPEEMWIDYRISYQLDLKEFNGTAKVWIPLPSDWDTQKDIAILGYSPDSIEIHRDSEGNRIIYWSEHVKEEQLFSEEFEISILKKKWKIDQDLIEDYDPDDPNVINNLGEERNVIQTFHPEIVELSEKIIGNETNPYHKAELIYEYLIDFLETGGDSNDALSTLRERGGQCGGVAFLYVALARASGVPSRSVTGITNIREGKFNWQENNYGTHVWAEFYLSGFGWIPIDIAPALFSNKKMFAEYPGNYLIFSKGTNVDLEHGIPSVNWFHMPYLNGTQEEWSDIYLIVEKK